MRLGFERRLDAAIAHNQMVHAEVGDRRTDRRQQEAADEEGGDQVAAEMQETGKIQLDDPRAAFSVASQVKSPPMILLPTQHWAG